VSAHGWIYTLLGASATLAITVLALVTREVASTRHAQRHTRPMWLAIAALIASFVALSIVFVIIFETS